MKNNWTVKPPDKILAFYWFLVDIVNNQNLHETFLKPELMQVDISGKYVSPAGKRVGEMILISDLPNAFWLHVETPEYDLEHLRGLLEAEGKLER